MTNITKPIIIVGTGRCGSTIFHRLLAKHPETMWLSGFCDRYPARPDLNRRAVTAMGNPLLHRLFGGRIQPGECYYFWDHYAYGFAEPCRDLVRTDVTARVKQQVRTAMGTMLTPARHRLLLKITGWPRLGYLNEIFEDARFIHLVRDGRAVAASLLHVDFWRGWFGPQGWRAGLLSPEDQALWEAYDRSFVALAGLEWRIQLRAMEAARRAVDPSRLMEIRYEDFCERPKETFREVLEFTELRSSPVLDAHLAATPIRNTSNRWREGLTAAQQHILEDLLRDDLRRYGYGAPEAAEQLRGTVAR
jgi:hypothetical protein